MEEEGKLWTNLEKTWHFSYFIWVILLRIFTLHSLPEFNFFQGASKECKTSRCEATCQACSSYAFPTSKQTLKKEVDCHVAVASIKHARELASLFPDENVFFFSADDKARVPLGLQVSKNQTAIQMYLKYRVKLLNHDFPIGKSIRWSHLFMLHVKKQRQFCWLQRANIHSYSKWKTWQKFCCFTYWRLSGTCISCWIQGSMLKRWCPETLAVCICWQWNGQGSKKQSSISINAHENFLHYIFPIFQAVVLKTQWKEGWHP